MARRPMASAPIAAAPTASEPTAAAPVGFQPTMLPIRASMPKALNGLPTSASAGHPRRPLRLRPLLPSPAEERKRTERHHHDQEAVEERDARAYAAERQRDQLGQAKADQERNDDDREQQQPAADAQQDRRAGRGRHEAHQA